MKMLMEVEQTRTERGSPGLEGSLVVDLPLTPSVILEKLLENLYLLFCLFRQWVPQALTDLIVVIYELGKVPDVGLVS